MNPCDLNILRRYFVQGHFEIGTDEGKYIECITSNAIDCSMCHWSDNATEECILPMDTVKIVQEELPEYYI